jgi:hypothetical protein
VQSTVKGLSLLVTVTILKDEIERKNTNKEKEKNLNQLG